MDDEVYYCGSPSYAPSSPSYYPKLESQSCALKRRRTNEDGVGVSVDSNGSTVDNWRQSNNKFTGLKYLLESGHLYDCTFQVAQIADIAGQQSTGDQATIYKTFKLHRLVLAMASSVMESMLFGHFDEAKKGPDDAIKISNVAPEVFEAVIKYIYFNEDPCSESGDLVVDVYLFAHEWQIEALLIFLDKQFSVYQDQDHLLQIYEMYKYVQNPVRAQNCLQTIRRCIGSLVHKEAWLNSAEDTVLDILRQDTLNLDSEVFLLEAVIRWARGHLPEATEGAQLRPLVDTCLRLIRFRSMSSPELARVLRDSGKLLTLDEQLGLLMDVALGSNEPALLPDPFERNNLPRKLGLMSSISFWTDNTSNTRSTKSFNLETFEVDGSGKPSETVFEVLFREKAGLHLVGIGLSSLHEELNEGLQMEVRCEVMLKGSTQLLAWAEFCGAKSVLAPRPYLQLNNPVALAESRAYSIKVSHHLAPGEKRKAKKPLVDGGSKRQFRNDLVTVILGHPADLVCSLHFANKRKIFEI